MDDFLAPIPPADEPTLVISVDLRPSECAAVVRWGVARTFRWRQLFSPVILLPVAGFVWVQLRRPHPASGLAASLLFGMGVALGAYLAFPYLIGAHLARSTTKSRIQLSFGQAGIRVRRFDGEPWLPWANVRVIETARMIHFVADDESCWLPKRLLNPSDDALVRQLAARASGHVLPAR